MLSERKHRPLGKYLFTLALVLSALIYLQVLRVIYGVPFSVRGFAGHLGVVVGVLFLARMATPSPGRGATWWRPVLLSGLAIAALLVSAWFSSTWLAALSFIALSALFLLFAQALWACTGGLRRTGVRWLGYGIILGTVSLCGGLTICSIDQVQCRFSEEEFFVAIRVFLLSVFYAQILAAHVFLASGIRGSKAYAAPERPRRRLLWLVSAFIGFGAAGGLFTIRCYQKSFFPDEAPGFNGITKEAPFVVSELPGPAPAGPSGAAIFDRLVERLQDRPNKHAPEYGMLALVTGEAQWAQAFRESLLEEASQRRYVDTSVTNIHYGQHLAAYRLYYLWKIQAAFPDLFNEAELNQLRTWFEDVNVAAFTIKLRDCLYATALSKWPEGPYENQETGAGLLALLEVTGYAAPELAAANRDYLARNPRGWLRRFSNNDDTFLYQVEWIEHAFYQSLYTGNVPDHNVRNAFEWLLLQQLPGGAVLEYNHPAQALRRAMPGINYLGASLLKDPRYLWLADQALTFMVKAQRHPQAQPGVEKPLDFNATSPTAGTALLYGNSGAPNQTGPLGPDKIVFRDGWAQDATYMLLNLRFTGWHRYKGTNTITLLYKEGAIAEDCSRGEPFAFLPEGRTYFRDKRVPRENLNGLLIERNGMSAVLHAVTSQGGPWAQDPPHFARVERFDTLGLMDSAHTVIDDWRGWRHDRFVYFFHGGFVVVIDRARARFGQAGCAIAWHLFGDGRREGRRLWLREGDSPVCAVWSEQDRPFLHLDCTSDGSLEQPNLSILYSAPCKGRLDLATVFLSDEWAGNRCEVAPLQDDSGQVTSGHIVEVSDPSGSIKLLHNGTREQIAAGGLATDGDALAVRHNNLSGETEICIVGGTTSEVAMAVRPAEVTACDGRELSCVDSWEWREGKLVIHHQGDTMCLNVR